MAGKGAVLALRILSELASIRLIGERIEYAWNEATANNDELYFDSVALNIHSFYSGIERIFEKISAAVDGTMPQGANWHQELLIKMSLEIPSIRPAVISEQTRNMLEPYRGFRHVVRNVYTYHINPEKMEPLAKNIKIVLSRLEKELTAFSHFIENR